LTAETPLRILNKVEVDPLTEDRETVTQDPIVLSLKTRLQDSLGENLKELWLFGSRARGDADEDSDYDVLVVAMDPERTNEETVLREGYGIMMSNFALVGSICYSPEAWVRSKRTPLGMNILKEGIRLL